jgi:hypothetical protein
VAASVLAHVLALGALTALPEHGPSTSATLAERSDGSPASRSAKVALVTPAPALTPARQDSTPNGVVAGADSAGAEAAPTRQPATSAATERSQGLALAANAYRPAAAAASTTTVGAAPSTRIGGPGAVPGASLNATTTGPLAASNEGLAPAKAPQSGGGPALATGLTRDTVPTAPISAGQTQALASANPVTALATAPLTTTTRQPGDAARAPAAATAADDDTQPPPVYVTRLPPPFRWTYALRRGAMSGQAELSLKRPGAGSELELKGNVLGMEVLGMTSRGSVAALGFMPERFVDRRRGKDRLAANFDHAAGRITYSGPPVTQPLLPGAQDRLSWMVQLAAIIDAAPERYPVGSRVALSVSGARGDVDTWTFNVQGRQRLTLPGGAVAEAVRLTREPRRPYDTQVETWLDPAQHHLPVRARLTVLPGGETLELSLAGS